MKQQSMRDAFWDRIYELAQTDKDIVIVSADFGAPSLDKFRRDFPDQYINTGISEQNAILLASGLALEGKKPIAYAITQFITLRCFEQIRIYPCGMNLPVIIVGVGSGVCYWESGPTHHCIEQLSVMRTLPNLDIINCSSQRMAREAADYVMQGMNPKYVQLDREIISGIYSQPIQFEKGFNIWEEESGNLMVATGNMVSESLKLRRKVQKKYKIMDMYKIPVNKSKFLEEIKEVKKIITLEENTRQGGIGSYLLEILSDNGIEIPILRMGLETSGGYAPSYNYGGREDIRKAYGMGGRDIQRVINHFFD